MRTSQKTSILAAVALATGGLLAAGPAEASASCSPHGHVLARSDSSVLYSVHGSAYGCLTADGSALRVTRAASKIHYAQLSGRYLAFEKRAADSSRVLVYDLRARRLLSSASTPQVASIFLTSAGTTAWVSQADPTAAGERAQYAVHVLRPGSPVELLDSGPDLQAGSLTLSEDQRTVFWSNGGLDHSTAVSASGATAAAARDGVVKASLYGQVISRHGVLYGRLHHGARHVLPGQTGGRSVPRDAYGKLRVDGRYIAYVTAAAGHTAYRVNVYDLHANRLVASRPATATGTATGVSCLVLKKSGSIAWIGSDADVYEVHAISRQLGPDDRLLDRGSALDPLSLGLSFYKRGIFWTARGGPHSAPLL
jgi:hypothetical protein